MSRASHASPPTPIDAAIFHAAFQRSPAMQSVIRATSGVMVEVNETFLSKLGFTREQVIGRTALELNFWVHPGELQSFQRLFAAQGHVSGQEVRLRAADGRLLNVLLSTHPVDIGGVTHLVSAGVDITARKEAETRLRESESRFSSAFHTSPVFMTIARGRDLRLVEVNDAFIHLTGWGRDVLIGCDTTTLGLWIDLDTRAQLAAQLQHTGEIRNAEVRLRTRSGEIRTVQLSGRIFQADGEPHLVTIGIDVTEQKRAEQAVREAEAQIRALYDSLTAAVVVHDETGYLQANPAAVRMFGATRADEFVGLNPAQLSSRFQLDGEPSAAALQRYLSRALADGSARFEWLARRFDGVEFPLDVTLTALPLGGRTVIQAVMHDLTERKRAEADLQNAVVRERELRQLKTEFVSLVSHEFRTPLEVIMSSADNLDRYHERLAPEQRAELLHTINKSVRRMAGMMEEVLVLGRLEGERMTFRPEPIDLSAFCRRVCDELTSATGGRCVIELHVNAAGAARGDENLLRHIFANVLSNAIKYSPAGESLRFVVAREGAYAVCRVVDRGCGIPAADQARLFQAFHRGANVRQVPGTGLGLLIVRRCVDLHGGEIAFESAEGRGTTFIVRLPLFAVEPSEVDS